MVEYGEYSKLSPEEVQELIKRFKMKYKRSPKNSEELDEFLEVERIIARL